MLLNNAQKRTREIWVFYLTFRCARSVVSPLRCGIGPKPPLSNLEGSS